MQNTAPQLVAGGGAYSKPDGSAGDDYVPAMLSNGRLCVFCDYTLSIPGEEPRYVRKNLRPGILLEGRRYGDNCGKAGSYAYQFFPQGLLATRLVVDGAARAMSDDGYVGGETAERRMEGFSLWNQSHAVYGLLRFAEAANDDRAQALGLRAAD